MSTVTQRPAAASRARRDDRVARPRVLMVGGSIYDLPLPAPLARKWDAVSELIDARVVARAGTVEAADPRFRLLTPPLRGPAFYAALPAIVAREIARFRPEVVIAQSPYEGFMTLPALRAARPRPRLVVELHGDWRTASRRYGSPMRRLYARLSDRVATVALRSADHTRALSGYTSRLAIEVTGRAPTAAFPTYFDLSSFTRTPTLALPSDPSVAWIGALQPTKDPAALAVAWGVVAAELPRARLTVVGDGPLRTVVTRLVDQWPGRVRALPRLSPPEVAAVLDGSTVLALTSASEGLGRVVLEAFARARPVVAFGVGGVPDLVESGRNGLLVPPGDAAGLGQALARVLREPALAEQLALGAREDLARHQWTSDRWAAALRDLVDRVLA